MSLPITNLDTSRVTEHSRFGMRTHPILNVLKLHEGIDWTCESGTPIYAIEDGIVSVSKMQSDGKGYGNYVVIQHKDKVSLYAHMSQRTVEAGQSVRGGSLIGYVGSTGDSTGPHLHFGLCKNFTTKDWYDPLPYLKQCEKLQEITETMERIQKTIEIYNPQALEKQLKEQQNTSMWFVIDKLLKKLGV